MHSPMLHGIIIQSLVTSLGFSTFNMPIYLSRSATARKYGLYFWQAYFGGGAFFISRRRHYPYRYATACIDTMVYNYIRCILAFLSL